MLLSFVAGTKMSIPSTLCRKYVKHGMVRVEIFIYSLIRVEIHFIIWNSLILFPVVPMLFVYNAFFAILGSGLILRIH
jgi:hypothetical protein